MKRLAFALLIGLPLHLWAQPANDDICNATVLSLENGICEPTQVYSWTNATYSSASGLPYCYNTQIKDVWYRLTVPASGQVTVATAANGFDICVEVWKGAACGSATVLNQSTDGFPCIYTSRPVSAPPTQTYSNLTPGSFIFLRAFSFDANQSSASLKLCVSNPASLGDEPCNAGFINVSPADPLGQTCLNSQTFSYSNATLTAGIPNPDCVSSMPPSNIRDVWMKVRVPSSGKLFLQAPYNGAYYVIQVFSATACNGTFTQIACAFASPASLSALAPNSVLYLRVFVWSGGVTSNGTFKICAEARNDVPAVNNTVGKVGIGIDSPFTKLQVVGTGFFHDKVVAGSDIETRGNLLVRGNIISSSGNTKLETPNLNVTGAATIAGPASFTAPASFAAPVQFSRLATLDSIGFTSRLGSKISLWGSMQGQHYGLGLQSGLLQLYSDAAAANIGFGYGSSGNFTERMRIINSGEYGMQVNGRLILRNGTADPAQAAGVWLSNPTNSGFQGFMGISNASLMGFFGGSRGWGLTYSTVNSNLGIGNTNPTRPLSFPAELGEKILLYPGSTGEVGIGVYGNELRLHADNPGAKVSFGTQDNAGNFTEVGKFEKNGAYGLSVFGSIWANGTTYASDGRFKKNIEPLENSLDKVLQLQGVSYQMNAEAFPKEHFDDATQVGLVAQEVEKIVPEVVTTGPDGYKAIDYAKLVPLLIEAIKNQQQQIEELKRLVKPAKKKSKSF